MLTNARHIGKIALMLENTRLIYMYALLALYIKSPYLLRDREDCSYYQPSLTSGCIVMFSYRNYLLGRAKIPEQRHPKCRQRP
mgnify:CR=1 FL=1